MSHTTAIDNRLRPLTALRAAGALFADPQDTRQVFVIMQAMRGRSPVRMMRRFRACPTGAAVLAEHRQLLAALQDDAALAALPAGSLGRAYQDFMQACQLTAGGLVDASMVEDYSGLPADARLLRERMRDMHDLTHVLTGYGANPLGELCLLAFMFAQTGNLGSATIALMGLARFGRGREGRPLRQALWEAYKRGRKAAWLPGLDYEALLARPLDALRRELRLTPAAHYPPQRV